MFINTEAAAAYLKEENELFSDINSSGKRFLRGLQINGLFKVSKCIGTVPKRG